MKIEEAIRITDLLSSSLRSKDGPSEACILEIARVLDEFELSKTFPVVGNLYRRFDRNPKDRVVGDALVRRLKKIFEFYLLENDPFIPRPSNGEVDGEIRIARTKNGFFGRTRLQMTEHQLIVGRSGVGKTNIQLWEFDRVNRIGEK